MRKCVFTEEFARDVAEIYSPRVKKELSSIIKTILEMPDIGSKNIPKSLKPVFGGKLMRFGVSPFDLYFEDDGQTVYFLMLVHQRQML